MTLIEAIKALQSRAVLVLVTNANGKHLDNHVLDTITIAINTMNHFGPDKTKSVHIVIQLHGAAKPQDIESLVVATAEISGLDVDTTKPQEKGSNIITMKISRPRATEEA